MSECDAVEARVEKGVTGCSLSKARWYAANAEGWMEDDDERGCTCHVGARQAAFCIQPESEYCKGGV